MRVHRRLFWLALHNEAWSYGSVDERFVAVAKLSKALAWLCCVRSCERPEFYAWQWRTLARADSANYRSISVVNE